MRASTTARGVPTPTTGSRQQATGNSNINTEGLSTYAPNEPSQLRPSCHSHPPRESQCAVSHGRCTVRPCTRLETTRVHAPRQRTHVEESATRVSASASGSTRGVRESADTMCECSLREPSPRSVPVTFSMVSLTQVLPDPGYDSNSTFGKRLLLYRLMPAIHATKASEVPPSARAVTPTPTVTNTTRRHACAERTHEPTRPTRPPQPSTDATPPTPVMAQQRKARRVRAPHLHNETAFGAGTPRGRPPRRQAAGCRRPPAPARRRGWACHRCSACST